MTTQEFKGPVDNVAGRDINIYPPTEPVEIDPSVSRYCSQCDGVTWRYTRHCIHCGFDQFVHDADVNAARLQKFKIKLGIGLAVIGFSLATLGNYLPQKISVWTLPIGGLCLLAAMGIVKN